MGEGSGEVRVEEGGEGGGRGGGRPYIGLRDIAVTDEKFILVLTTDPKLSLCSYQ